MIADSLYAAWREVRRRRLRSLGVIAGYALAAAAMIVLLSLIRLQHDSAAEVLAGTGTHFIAFAPYGAPEYSCPECTPIGGSTEGFYAETVSTALLPFSLVRAVSQLAVVRDASPYLLFRFQKPETGSLVTAGGFDTKNTVAVRTTTCAPSNVVSGRFLQPGETGSVMVEEAYSKSAGLEVGDSIILGAARLTVVGVVNTGIRPVKADVYMTLEDLQVLIEKRIDAPLWRRFNILLVEAGSALQQKAAMDEVQRLIGQSGILSTYNCYIQAAQVMGMEASSLRILTVVIILLVVMFSAKTQYASILERRREIGILKSIGWSNRNIAGQVIWEGLFLSFAGFVIGAVAAAAGLLIYQVFGIPAAADGVRLFGDIFLAALIVVPAGGIVAGCIPAYMAARQNPAEALRSG